MTKNVGRCEKPYRIGLGIVVIGLGLLFQSWWGILGIFLILSAQTGHCLLTKAMGINTVE